MWISKVKTDEVYPLVKQRYNLDRIGHEFFLADGRVAAQFSIRHTPEVPFYQHGDLFVNTDGSEENAYTLSLSAGKFMRITVCIFPGQADLFKNLINPVLNFLFIGYSPVL